MTGTGALLCRVFGSSACPLQKDWEIRTRPAPRRNSPRETRAGTKTCQIIPHRSYRKRSQRSTISMRRRTSFWTRWRPRSTRTWRAFSSSPGCRNPRLIQRLAIKCALLALASPQATSSSHLQYEGARDRSRYERGWRQSTRRSPT